MYELEVKVLIYFVERSMKRFQYRLTKTWETTVRSFKVDYKFQWVYGLFIIDNPSYNLFIRK